MSTTWSLKLQDSLNLLDIGGHGDQIQDLLTLQPTMPLWLTRKLKFITRPKFTFLNVQPYAQNGTLHCVPGFGDTTLDLALSPKTDP